MLPKLPITHFKSTFDCFVCLTMARPYFYLFEFFVILDYVYSNI